MERDGIPQLGQLNASDPKFENAAQIDLACSVDHATGYRSTDRDGRGPPIDGRVTTNACHQIDCRASDHVASRRYVGCSARNDD